MNLQSPGDLWGVVAVPSVLTARQRADYSRDSGWRVSVANVRIVRLAQQRARSLLSLPDPQIAGHFRQSLMFINPVFSIVDINLTDLVPIADFACEEFDAAVMEIVDAASVQLYRFQAVIVRDDRLRFIVSPTPANQIEQSELFVARHKKHISF